MPSRDAMSACSPVNRMGVAERVAVQEKPKGKRHYNQPERLHGQEAAKPPCQHAMHGASPQIRQPECESLAQQHDSAAPEKLRPGWSL